MELKKEPTRARRVKHKVKRSIKKNWFYALVATTTTVALVLAYTLNNQVDVKNRQIEGLHAQLTKNQEALTSYQSQVSTQKDQITALRGYYEPSHVGSNTVGIVSDKYAENGQYTLRIDNDYFNVDYETWESVAVGQEVDYAGWEKAE